MSIADAYLAFNGLTLCNYRINWRDLPGGGLGDETLYHMFASGLFDHVEVREPWSDEVRYFRRSDMQRYVSERDRREIRRLQAQIQEMKERKEKNDAERTPVVPARGAGARGGDLGLGAAFRERSVKKES
jgi:hypothetical protein